MYAVETCLQLWQEDCMTSIQWDRFTNNILDCHQLIKTVCFGTFSLKLSSSFIEPPNPKEPEAVKSAAAAKPEGGKKDSKKKCLNKFTKNASPCPNFKLKKGEMWDTSFDNKVIDKRVIWNDKSKMCPHWHIYSHYFENCFNTNSHVKDSKIPSKKIAKFKESVEAICKLNRRAWHLGLGSSTAQHPCKPPNASNKNVYVTPMTNTKFQLTWPPITPINTKDSSHRLWDEVTQPSTHQWSANPVCYPGHSPLKAHSVAPCLFLKEVSTHSILEPNTHGVILSLSQKEAPSNSTRDPTNFWPTNIIQIIRSIQNTTSTTGVVHSQVDQNVTPLTSS